MAQKNKSILKESPIQWEKPYFYQNELKFIPKIYLPQSSEDVPENFNAVIVDLDGRIDCDLDWKDAVEIAKKHILAGRWILWNLHLGLFQELEFPLSNVMQFRSLALTLEHFIETIWKPFSSHTLGIVLYQGFVDFRDIPLEENEEKPLELQAQRLFYRDVAINYLNSLIDLLPQSLESFILLDAQNVQEPLSLAELLYEDDFEKMHIAIKNSVLPTQGLVWEIGEAIAGYVSHQEMQLSEQKEIQVAVCLPPPGSAWHEALNQTLITLNQSKTPYRLILEKNIAAEWDGLEKIFVVGEFLSESGKRMLKGFQAAGGIVEDVDILHR